MGNHWKNRDKQLGYRLPIALIVAIIIGAGLGYLLTNKFAYWRDWQAFDPTTSIDTWIPVIPWMIVPYSTLYFYYPMAAILGMKSEQTQRENVIFHQILLMLTWMVFVIFILVPVEVDIRSSVFLRLTSEFGSHGTTTYMLLIHHGTLGLHYTSSKVYSLCW